MSQEQKELRVEVTSKDKLINSLTEDSQQKTLMINSLNERLSNLEKLL